MPSSGNAKSQVCGPHAEYDARRTLEFYRYYEAFETLSGIPPTWVDLHDVEATTQHQPASSPDKALTAFCQLVAIQLGVERALVMFFDDQQGYILAEATKSTLLQKSKSNFSGKGEGLWLGHAAVPKGFAVCEHTINLPANHGSNRHTPSAAQIHIINDLQNDARFSNRPFVTDGPRARFYAGAPITTPRGINIGAVCALDSQPRDGLSESEIEFLIDIATTITEHLEATQARAEKIRGNQMASGLSAFLQGTSMKGGRSNLVTKRTSEEQAKDSGPRNKLGRQSTTPSRQRQGSLPPLAEDFSSKMKVTEVFSEPEAIDVPTEPESKQYEDRSSEEANQPFPLAASIIKNALDVDGVLFVDAAVDTFGGLADDTKPSRGIAGRRLSSFAAFDEFSWTNDQPGRDGNCPSKEAVCGILGEAYKNGRVSVDQRKHRSITQRFFRSLLQNYPEGKIWAFDEAGALAPSAADVEFNGSELNSTSGLADGDWRRSTRIQESAMLINCFPRVRSIVFVPMWNHSAERWVAGTLLYSYSPTRTFSYEGDVNFLTVFNNVILAELARSETEATLQAKTDFIASITHELRTPLHGIMGTVEHLRDELTSPFATKLLTQVDTCGKLLLEMIDNLLVLSAMSNQSTTQHQSSDPSPLSRNRSPMNGVNPSLGSSFDLVDIALDDVTEQAVEALAYSYYCSSNRQEVKDIAVSIIIDIDQKPHQSWQCGLPIGAWDRVCLNLVDNALKFTTNGYVLISLKQVCLSSRPHAQLTIEDTGCGISKDFLANSLFRGFSQADSFVSGMGLGLTVVAKIVNSLGGIIDVQSTQGNGTKVTVTVPLEPVPKCSKESRQDCERKTGLVLQDVVVGFLDTWDHGSQPPEDPGQSLLRATAKKSLEQLGILVSRDDGSCSAAKLNLIFESDLSLLLLRIEQARTEKDEKMLQNLSQKPIIVICKSYFSARILETTARERGLGTTTVVEYLAEPCGPAMLSAAVRSCLEQCEPSMKRTSGSEAGVATPKTNFVARTDEAAVLPRASPNCHVRPVSREGQTLTPTKDKSGQIQVLAKIMPTPNHKSAGVKGPALNVMLVDDNSINLQLLETYCRKRGHQSTVAMDGIQAVRLYETASVASLESNTNERALITGSGDVDRPKAPPDVILMDINMPIMDGVEATRRIRCLEKARGRKHRALIIAITGVGSAEARQKAHANGMDLFFQKPVKLKELTHALEERFPVAVA